MTLSHSPERGSIAASGALTVTSVPRRTRASSRPVRSVQLLSGRESCEASDLGTHPWSGVRR
jgi:hypothetical protein